MRIPTTTLLSSFRKIVHQRNHASQTSASPMLRIKISAGKSHPFSLTPRRAHPKFLAARFALIHL
jgi:hypothetical protein